MTTRRVAAAACVAWILSSGAGSAHDLAKTTVTATFDRGRYAIDLRTDAQLLLLQVEDTPDDRMPRTDAEWRAALLARADRLRAAVSVRFDGTRVDPSLTLSVSSQAGIAAIAPGPVALVRLRGDIPRGAATFQWAYALLYGPYALAVRRGPGGPVTTEWLSGKQASAAFSLAQTPAGSAGHTIARYAALGYTHILPGGFDHILFVLGLCLLSRRVRPLLSQVSAFTVAHSVTLGLSMYGVIAAPTGIVEPLIAASIALVAIENVFTSELRPWRIVVVFAFGLLHGLGFAGALAELGLPREQFLAALVSFNAGVEAGQMSVVALAFLALAVWTRGVDSNRRRLVVTLSAAIAATGIYWTVARMLG